MVGVPGGGVNPPSGGVGRAICEISSFGSKQVEEETEGSDVGMMASDSRRTRSPERPLALASDWTNLNKSE